MSSLHCEANQSAEAGSRLRSVLHIVVKKYGNESGQKCVEAGTFRYNFLYLPSGNPVRLKSTPTPVL